MIIWLYPLSLFILFFLFLVSVQICNSLRYRDYHHRFLYSPLKKPPYLSSFQILDPYHGRGIYRKAQLHLHTSNSVDVFPKIPVAEVIRKYREAGYEFLVITDHDKVTEYPALNSPDFLVIPGMEETLVSFFWPLGRHLLKIGVTKEGRGGKGGLGKKAQGETLALAHPNWGGNLGTGRWFLSDLIRLSNVNLLEIYNRHSDSADDIRLWHKALEYRGYKNPLWGVAVDDSDNADDIDRGWIMIKTEEVSKEAFLAALNKGSFYATSGPTAEFRVEGKVIKVSSSEEGVISFINNRNEIVASFRAAAAEYRPGGDEGFIRVEVKGNDGKTAWSQPFFLTPESGTSSLI